jgi:hypothetical protein
MLSVLLTPVSLAPFKCGAAIGARGARVSIVTLSPADGAPVSPLVGSRVAAVTLNVPSAVKVESTEYVPPTPIVSRTELRRAAQYHDGLWWRCPCR